MELYFSESEFESISGDKEAFIREIFKDLMILFRLEVKSDTEREVYWGSGRLATVLFESEGNAKVVFVKDDYGRAICGLVKDRHPNKFL